MQLIENKNTRKFDYKKIETILIEENKFISNLFSVLPLPINSQSQESEQDGRDPSKIPKPPNKTSRATSLIELQTRLEKFKQTKASYKVKLQKKSVKNKLKKKLKQDQRKAQRKLLKIQSAAKPPNEITTTDDKPKPVFNGDDKLVFSKLNFAGLGDKKHKKGETNPKKLLERVENESKRIEELKLAGDTEKAIERKEKVAWKNALAKSQGRKVKDDPVLLKKSIQKLDQKKRSSKKKWDARLDGVTKAKDEKQKKRTENIDKRKKDKKVNKMKKAAKKGRIIPGF